MIRSTLPEQHKQRIREIGNSLAELPGPVCNAITAAHRYRVSYSEIENLQGGGMAMSANKIEFSVNDLLSLLDGTFSADEFHLRYGSGKNRMLEDFFLRIRKEGRTLDAASVVHSEHRDDDLIVFKFGAPDASRLPFRVPPLD